MRSSQKQQQPQQQSDLFTFNMQTPRPKRKTMDDIVTATRTSQSSRKKAKRPAMDQLLSPLQNRGGKTTGDTEDAEVSANLAAYLEKTKQFDTVQKKAVWWRKKVDDAEDGLEHARTRRAAVQTHYDENERRKQTAMARKGKFNWDLVELQAEKKKALLAFEDREARLKKAFKKEEEIYLEANGRTQNLLDKIEQEEELVAAAEVRLTKSKEDFFKLELPVDRVARTYVGWSGQEIFDDIRLPFAFSSRRFFSILTLRKFIKALRLFGYEKASLLHAKNDMSFGDLWRDTCSVLGIEVTDEDILQDIAEIDEMRNELSSLLEEARAMEQAQNGAIELFADGEPDDSPSDEENDFGAEEI